MGFQKVSVLGTQTGVVTHLWTSHPLSSTQKKFPSMRPLGKASSKLHLLLFNLQIMIWAILRLLEYVTCTTPFWFLDCRIGVSCLLIQEQAEIYWGNLKLSWGLHSWQPKGHRSSEGLFTAVSYETWKPGPLCSGLVIKGLLRARKSIHV